MSKNKMLTFLIYLYIALPFLIFAGGFLKWYFAVPAVAMLGFALFFAVKASSGIEILESDKYTALRITAGLVIIIAIVLLSGIGDILWQNRDHATRNTLFQVLSEFSWPPRYITDAGNEVGLVYYIGFWLPSALCAKIFGVAFGYIFQIIWAVLGLFLLWYMLCIAHKRIVLYPLVIFLFFGGLDIVGYGIIEAFFSNLSRLQIGTWVFPQGSAITTHIEWWARYFQYSSHTTQLFWVFNQCLPVWLATVLILLEKNNRNMVFIMGLTLISSTLPFIGLIPIFIWCAVCDHEGDLLHRPFTPDVKGSFLSLFTYQNVVGGGISGIMSFLYLIGNIATAQSSQSTTAQSTPSAFSVPVFFIFIVVWIAAFLCLCDLKNMKPVKLLYLVPMLPLAYLAAKLNIYKLEYYLLFVILEFLVLALLIMPAYRKSSLLFLTVSCLLLIPFFTVGTSIDFCMRASIPLLAVLCLFAIQSLDKYFADNRQILATLLCAALMLGALTPVKEIARTVEATAYEISTNGKVENNSITVHQVFASRNFTGKTENNVFFETFAK